MTPAQRRHYAAQQQSALDRAHNAAAQLQAWFRANRTRKALAGQRSLVSTEPAKARGARGRLRDLLANHGKRGMSAKRMSRLTGCQFTHLALRPNNRPVCFGAVRFPTSKRVPAKWACIGPSTDEEQVDTLVRCLLQTWRMPQPRVIISIVGCESDAELERSMKAQHRLVFIRGLLRAARTTHAWILTSGKSGGVDGIVGRSVMDDRDAGAETVCLGLAAWDEVELHEEMEVKPNGAVFDYNLPSTAARVGLGLGSSSSFGLAGGEDLDAPSPQLTARVLAEQQRAAAFERAFESGVSSARQRRPLDANHTHFLLVDDPEGVRGSETELRAKLELALCNYRGGADHEREQSDLKSSSHHDLRVETPGVVLVVGGGLSTLGAVLRALSHRRPVIALVDSGGAAEHLALAWQLVHDLELQRQRQQQQQHASQRSARTPGEPSIGGRRVHHRAKVVSPRSALGIGEVDTDAESGRADDANVEHTPGGAGGGGGVRLDSAAALALLVQALQRDQLFDALMPTEQQQMAYASMLLRCCDLGRRLEGANREAQLSFFRTSSDVEGRNNELDVVIEQAILSDCEHTTDAIHHVRSAAPLHVCSPPLAAVRYVQRASSSSRSPRPHYRSTLSPCRPLSGVIRPSSPISSSAPRRAILRALRPPLRRHCRLPPCPATTGARPVRSRWSRLFLSITPKQSTWCSIGVCERVHATRACSMQHVATVPPAPLRPVPSHSPPTGFPPCLLRRLWGDCRADRYRLMTSEMREMLRIDTPGILLVIGGKNDSTLKSVHQALLHRRPVIALVDSGDAAEHLWLAYEATRTYGPGAGFQLMRRLQADSKFVARVPGDDPTYVSSYVSKLIECCAASRRHEALKARGSGGGQSGGTLSFFRGDVEGNRLEDVIKDAMLASSAMAEHADLSAGMKLLCKLMPKNSSHDPLSSYEFHLTERLAVMRARLKQQPSDAGGGDRGANENGELPVRRRRNQRESCTAQVVLPELAATPYARSMRTAISSASAKDAKAAAPRSFLRATPPCTPSDPSVGDAIAKKVTIIGDRVADEACTPYGRTPCGAPSSRAERTPSQASRSRPAAGSSQRGRRAVSLTPGESPMRFSSDKCTRLHPSVKMQLGQYVASKTMSTVANGLFSLGAHRIDLRPEWRDLMMWAVLMGNQPLARLLWERTSEPTRAAIMASRACHRLKMARGEKYDDQLEQQADEYENWAIGVLDAVDERNEAKRLLEQVPSVQLNLGCEGGGAGAGGGGWGHGKQRRGGSSGSSGGVALRPVYMWQRSVLDEASQDTTCLRFVAHKHCQYVLTSYHNSSDVLSGGGRVRISESAAWPEILLTIFSCGLATSCLHLQPTAGEARPTAGPAAASARGDKRRVSWLPFRTSERLSGGGSGAQSADENDSDSSDDESEEEYDADYFDTPDDRSLFNQQQGRAQRSRGLVAKLRVWWAAFSIPRVRFCLHAACLVFYLLVLTTHIGGGVTGWNGRAPRQYTGQLSPKLWTFAWELPQWCSGCSGWDMYELLVELLGWLITFSRWVEEAYQLSVSGSLGAYLSNGCKPSLACPRSPHSTL